MTETKTPASDASIQHGDAGRLYTWAEVEQIRHLSLRTAELRLEAEAEAARSVGLGRRAASRAGSYRRAAEIVKAVRLRHA